MPTYSYRCTYCGHAYEDMKGINDPYPAECPSCLEPWGERFGQDFGDGRQVGVVYGNPTTIGQQAELNAKRLGKEQMALMKEASDRRTSRFTGKLPKGAKVNTTGTDRIPWYRDGSIPGTDRQEKPIDLKRIKDVNKYIEGEE